MMARTFSASVPTVRHAHSLDDLHPVQTTEQILPYVERRPAFELPLVWFYSRFWDHVLHPGRCVRRLKSKDVALLRVYCARLSNDPAPASLTEPAIVECTTRRHV